MKNYQIEFLTTPSVHYKGVVTPLTEDQVRDTTTFFKNITDLRYLSLECEDGVTRYFNPNNIVWAALVEVK